MGIRELSTNFQLRNFGNQTKSEMDCQLRSVIIALIVIALQGIIDGRKVHNRDEIESRRAINLANRELKASKTSIVAYNKTQIIGDDVDKEAERIEAKCAELNSPCHVTKLKSIC